MNCKSSLLALLLLFCFVENNYSQTIIRGPYLQSGTLNSMVIRWRTDIATNSKVWYGNSPTNLNNTVVSGIVETEHELLVSGLNANTTYYYAVGSSNDGQLAGADADHYFKTSPNSSTTQAINLWVLGDAGTKDDNQRAVRDAFYNYNGSDHIDMMLLLGDNAYSDGTDTDFQFAWFENMYEDRLINSTTWSCFGNHDADSADSATETGPYYDIFTFPDNGQAGGIPSGTEAYYSYNYGNIHVVVLNTTDVDRSAGGAMIQWLQNDLASANEDWLIAIFHHPVYSGFNNISTDTDTRAIEMRQNALPLLENAGVDLVMVGHHHTYQRSFLIKDHYGPSYTFNPNTMGLDLGDGRIGGDNAYRKDFNGPDQGDGAVYMVTGSAGKVSGGNLSHPVMYHNNDLDLGSVSVKVTDLQMDVKFIDDNDNIDDYFTIIKQVDPPIVSITNPADGTFYPSPQTINITANASDPNGNVTQVEFFVNNTSIGTDNAAPYSKSWTMPANGNYELKAVATDNDGNIKTTKIYVQVGGTVTVCSRVNQSSDDAEEKGSGSVKLSSSDIELIFDGSNQTVGLRFVNLNIQQGAIINSANIQFATDDITNLNPCNINIYGEAHDNAPTFSNSNGSISSRSKTNASVVWSPPNWVNFGEIGPDQLTVDLAPVIQEIVDRPGFTSNSSIVILMDGTGRRTAESYDADVNLAPELCLEYGICADDDGDGTCNDFDLCPGGPEPGATCNDNNSLTYDDLIDNNCNCVGTPYDCPVFPANIGDTCDDGNPNTVNDMVDANCNCMGTIPSGGITISAKVINTGDDAEEKSNGNVSNTSSDLELVYDGSNQTVGMRFVNLGIPQGSIISDAYIQFTVDETTNTNPCVINIFGQDSDNALAFANANFNISNRTTTNTMVTWSPANWLNKGDAGVAQQTVNIASILQEIVNRPGFTVNSPIAIIMTGSGERVGESYDGSIPDAPELFITYQLSCPDSDGDGSCDANDLCPGGPEPGTSCNDNNAATYDDEIDSNCNCVGTPYDCPSFPANIGDACDDGDPNTINDVVDSNCICIGVDVGNSVTTSATIISSSDDAEEKSNGNVTTGSSDLELIWDYQTQTVGMRFVNLNIPQGALITDAYIQFTVDETTNTNPCNLMLYGEDTDNALTFSSSNLNITNRTKTNASVLWSPGLWLQKGDAGPAQKTANLSSLIQEIVDRPGYTSNSSIAIIVDGTGERVAESFDGEPTSAPVLHVSYETSNFSGGGSGSLGELLNEGAFSQNLEHPTLPSSVIKVYPNPATDHLNLLFKGYEEGELIIQIINLRGEIEYRDIRTVKAGDNNILLEDLKLQNGLYCVYLHFNDRHRVAKFTIMDIK